MSTVGNTYLTLKDKFAQKENGKIANTIIFFSLSDYQIMPKHESSISSSQPWIDLIVAIIIEITVKTKNIIMPTVSDSFIA